MDYFAPLGRSQSLLLHFNLNRLMTNGNDRSHVSSTELFLRTRQARVANKVRLTLPYPSTNIEFLQ